MNDTGPTPEFIAALAASLGGTLQRREDERLPVIRLDSPRCLLCIRSSWEARPKWRASIRSIDDQHIHQSASANFDSKRPLPAIVADIRRRVLEASRDAIRAHGVSSARDNTKAQDTRAKVAQLETILDASNDLTGYSHNHFVRLPGLRVSSEYALRGDHGAHTAEISVRSFDCLLMIARLVAEDNRLHASRSEA